MSKRKKNNTVNIEMITLSSVQQSILSSIETQGYNGPTFFFNIFDNLTSTNNIIVNIGTTSSQLVSQNVKIFAIDSTTPTPTFSCIGVTFVDANGVMTFNASTSTEYFITLLYAPSYDENAMTVTWNDSFDYTGAPDSSVWAYDIGNNNGWGNEELEYYTDGDNVTVSDGSLTITAKYDSTGAVTEDGTTYDYTSTRIHTIKSFLYGKFTFTAKIPSDEGFWGAIWMLPENNSYGNWPLSGEIDIVEAEKGVGNIAHQSLQTENMNCKLAVGCQTSAAQINSVSDEHTYELIWTPDKIIMGVDGSTYFESSRDLSQPLDTNSYPFVQPFYIILNLAIGGLSGGTVDNTSFPQSMEISNITVYDLGLDNFLLNNNVNFNYIETTNPKIIDITNFSDCFTGFSVNNYGGESTYSVNSSGELVIDVTSVGSNEWDISAEWGTFDLVKGEVYDYSITLTSSIDREVGADFIYLNNGDDVQSMTIQTLTANTSTVLTSTYTSDVDASGIDLRLFLGNFLSTSTDVYPDHTITISAFSITNTSNAVTETQNVMELPSTFDTYTQEGILLSTTNEGFNSNLWSKNITTPASATFSYSDQPIYSLLGNIPTLSVEITDSGSAYTDIQSIYTPVSLIEGVNYSFSLKIMSTITRDIQVILTNPNSGVNYCLDTISLTANEITFYTVNAPMIQSTDSSASFKLLLGSNESLGTHTIIMSDISIINNSVYYKDSENIIGSSSSVLPNLTSYTQTYKSDFTDNETGWTLYANTGCEASASLDTETGVLSIDVPESGINAYEVQEIYSPLPLTENDTYMYYLTMESSVDRDVTIVCQYENSENNYVEFFDDVVSLTSNNPVIVSASHEITTTTDSASFIIDLGGNGTSAYPDHTVSISNVFILNTSVTQDVPTYTLPTDPNETGTTSDKLTTIPSSSSLSTISPTPANTTGGSTSSGSTNNSTSGTTKISSSTTSGGSSSGSSSSTDSSGNLSNSSSSNTSSKSSSTTGKGDLLTIKQKMLIILYLLQH